jgi:hypothetical protein
LLTPTASFRELGPPDLCHVVKSYGSKGAQKDLGSYHYWCVVFDTDKPQPRLEFELELELKLTFLAPA